MYALHLIHLLAADMFKQHLRIFHVEDSSSVCLHKQYNLEYA